MTRRSFSTVVATALFAITAFLLPVNPAVAATIGDAPVGAPAVQAGCYGDWCSGQDPEAMGCSAGAYTVASAWAGSYLVELRWSPSCQTNWARIGGSWTGPLWVVQSTGYKHSYSGSNGSYRWTAMIYSPSLACRAEAGSTYTAWV
ncbi:DUF2690 domain-containing protein [Micromonospora sp. WMMD882]|uniref:DUF2690 domain-containing protein n=1 Tax=Micromonospora sp. WMMD882 TaxID=3015151 RepID=UPI00248BD5F4|nr:DUF2690 domain-containing protein [Micromonospora sp. WMMD882]WBB77252.1 DUF2690 domain-containing protein [Micromonospora sp. WMMD882]